MNSDTIKDHGATDRVIGQARKPWVTPSLQVLILKSAEHGLTGNPDHIGSHASRGRS